MRVREIMTSPAVTIREDATLEEAAKLMLQKNIGCLPVVNEKDDLCGIVTPSDFCAKEKAVPFSLTRLPRVLGEWMPKENIERVYEAARRTAISEIMSRSVSTLTEEDSLESVLEKMLKRRVHHLPVIRGRKVVGVVARRDLLQVMREHLP
jgi:CBS domain-containing protein